MIGDPSEREWCRPFQDSVTIENNTLRLIRQIETFKRTSTEYLKFMNTASTGPEMLVLNNHDWFGKMSMVEFLRETGKHVRVSRMLERDR
jgi:tyrosyl-tRNA synthetase